MAKSKFKISIGFKKKINRLKIAIEEAAAIAMQEGIRFAAEEAREKRRWASGDTNSTDDWEWQLTGLAQESIQGLVISKPLTDRAQQISPRKATTWVKSKGGLREVWTHQRKTMRYPLPRAKKNLIVAKLIMNAQYTKWLQGKEVNGSESGMEAGDPVVTKELRDRWRKFIFPQIVLPRLRLELRKRS